VVVPSRVGRYDAGVSGHRLVAALVLALPACASAGGSRAPNVVALSPVTPRAATLPSSPDDHDTTAVDRLTAALRAYIEGGEPGALFELWAPDLSVRAGRARTQTQHDSLFGKNRLAAIYGWAAAHQTRASLRVERQRFESDGHAAMVDWAIVLGQGTDAAAFGEHYLFEKRGGEWKMVRFEYWPLMPDTLEELGPSRFGELDAKVEESRDRGDERNVAYYLMAAYRFDECAEVSRRLTEETPEEPWVWDMRAKASALVGDRADAELSTAEAERRRASAKK